MNIIEYQQLRLIYRNLLRVDKGKIENRKNFNIAIKGMKLIIERESERLGVEE